MKILCVVYFDSAKQTGHVAHARGLFKSLAREGHELHIVAPGWDTQAAGVKVTNVWQWKRSGFYTLTYMLAALPRIAMALIKERPDVVYARYFNFLFVPALVSRLLGVPMVVEHNADSQTEHVIYGRGRVSRALHDLAERLLLALSNGSIAVTDSIVESWRKRNFKVRNVLVVRNGVDAGVYRPLEREACRAAIGLSPARPYVCYVGSFSEVQGLRFLLSAFEGLLERFPDTGLLLVGAESSELRKPLFVEAQRTFGERLLLVPAVPADKAAMYIGAADVCVAPYTKGAALSPTTCAFGDPMKGDPLKIYSYMAGARPIVASYFREAGKQVESIGAGLAVPPEDPEQLCSALERLLGDPAMAAEMGQRGRAYVEGHATWDIVARRTIDFVRSLDAK
jgi:glycosyltransferase involved in cell wall biosynthesis